MLWGKILVLPVLLAGCGIEYGFESINQKAIGPTTVITVETTEDTPPLQVDTGEPPEPSAEIEVTPTTHSFGDCLLECEVTTTIEISSVGQLDLTVNKLTYSGPGDLILDVNYMKYGGLPWILQPGSTVSVTVSYFPGAESYHLGYLTVESDDLTDPTVIVGQEGTGIRHGTMIDEFVQEEQLELDILFVIDNSCSMGSEQSELAFNSDLFIAPLSVSGADFHIGTITTDSPSFRGPVITPATPDIIAEFQDQIVAGTGGDATEKGLEMASSSLRTGGDAGPGGAFFRDEANLVVVIVSDEDDFSPGAVIDYVSDMTLTKDPTITTFSLHSVAGTYPSSTCADPAERYDEAVSLGGGQFFDICASDWGYQVEQIAEDSLSSVLFYPLTEDPVVDSIEVFVNGIPVLSGWTYSYIDNSIVFEPASVPTVGSVITVEYGFYGECPT
jgi:hypothetical protein